MEKTIVRVEIIRGNRPDENIEGEWEVGGYGVHFGKDAIGGLNLKRIVRWDDGTTTDNTTSVIEDLDALDVLLDETNL